jgi:hypothetical protein
MITILYEKMGKMESDIEHLQDDVKEVKKEVLEVKSTQRWQFGVLLGVISIGFTILGFLLLK